MIRERSYLTPYFEKEVASEVVNISDLPELVGETGSYLFDDEGIIAKKHPLWKMEFLHIIYIVV